MNTKAFLGAFLTTTGFIYLFKTDLEGLISSVVVGIGIYFLLESFPFHFSKFNNDKGGLK